MYKLMVAYPFLFHKEKDGGYFIECVDIQGVYTGIDEDDIAYGISMAEEVLGMTLADLIESSEHLPIPSNINALSCDDGFVTMIRVNIEDYLHDTTMVRKSLTIPKWANDFGVRNGINFSKLLTDELSKIAIK